MRTAAVLALMLAGCGQAPLPSPPAANLGEPRADHRPDCPPVPGHVRAAARANVDLPAGEDDRARLTGDGVLADLAKRRALTDLIALYERCRAMR